MSRGGDESKHQSVFNAQPLYHVHILLPHQVGIIHMVSLHDEESVEPCILVLSPPLLCRSRGRFTLCIGIKRRLKPSARQRSLGLSLLRLQLLAHLVGIVAHQSHRRLALSCFSDSPSHLVGCHELLKFRRRALLARQSKIITVVKHNSLFKVVLFHHQRVADFGVVSSEVLGWIARLVKRHHNLRRHAAPLLIHHHLQTATISENPSPGERRNHRSMLHCQFLEVVIPVSHRVGGVLVGLQCHHEQRLLLRRCLVDLRLAFGLHVHLSRFSHLRWLICKLASLQVILTITPCRCHSLLCRRHLLGDLFLLFLCSCCHNIIL